MGEKFPSQDRKGAQWSGHRGHPSQRAEGGQADRVYLDSDGRPKERSAGV